MVGDPEGFISAEGFLILLMIGEELPEDTDKEVDDDCFSTTKVAEIRLFLG